MTYICTPKRMKHTARGGRERESKGPEQNEREARAKQKGSESGTEVRQKRNLKQERGESLGIGISENPQITFLNSSVG